MKQFALFIINHPRKILIGTLAITLIMIWGIMKLEIRNNQDSELPEDDPIVQTIDRIDEVFDDKSMVIIGIESKDIYRREVLQKISDISEELKTVDWIIPDEINSLSSVNSIKARDWGLETGPFMKEVPQTEEALKQLKEDVLSNDNIYGQLVSKDGTFAAIVANVEEGFDQAQLHKAIYALADKYQGDDKIYVSGEPIWIEDIESGINSDSQILTPVALLSIIICLFLCFRTLRGVLLPFIVVVLSIIWTMGMMGHIGLPMTVVSNALPALMVAVASSYGIHMIHRYYEEMEGNEKMEGIRNAIERITPPIFITGATSALGAATLIVFRVTSMREFGVIAAMGILSAMVLSVTVIPATLVLLKKAKGKRDNFAFITRRLVRLSRWSFQHRIAVLAIYGLVFFASLYGISRIIVGADFIQNFPKDHKGRVAVDAFNEKLGGVRFFNIMVEGKEADALKDPEFLREILKFQDYMEHQEGVGNVFSFADIIKRMHGVINEDSVDHAALPASSDLIAQYLLLYSMSGDPGDFKDLIDFDYQRAKIQVMLTTSEPQDHKHLYKVASEYLSHQFHDEKLAGFSFGGDVMFWIAQIGYIVRGKLENVVSSLIIILIFCALIYRSIKASLFSMVPLVISLFIIFGLMGYAGIRLEMGTAILTAMIAGIGVDFAIHYLNRFKEEISTAINLESACIQTAHTSGQAITFDVFSNVAGFSVLVVSGFLPVQNFGLLLALSMLVVGFNTMFMFPAMMAIIRPRHFLLSKPQPQPAFSPAMAVNAQ